MHYKITELIVNTGDGLINYGKYEQDALQAIINFEKANNDVDANHALQMLLSLKDNGVLFQSRLTFNNVASGKSRLPSIDVLNNIPGFDVIYGYVVKHCKISKIFIASFKRVILNIFLCSNAINLLDIDQTAWKKIIDSWRDDDQSFASIFGNNCSRRSALAKIADAYSILKGDHSYKKILGRKPQHGKLGVLSGTYMVNNPSPENLVWTELYVVWLNNQAINYTEKHNEAFKLLINWLANYPPHISQNPIVFLSEQRRFPSICAFIGNKKAYEIGIMFRFTEWIIVEQMMDSSEDGVVRIGHSIITANELSLLKQDLPIRATESTSNPLPAHWRKKVVKILSDDNFAWPKSLENQYFTCVNTETGKTEQIWVPTLTYLFLTMLEIPLRRIQVLCLDSGEGDLVLYDPKKKEWVENTGELAGYWDRHPEATVVNRGVLRKFDDNDNLVGLNINTNKGDDKKATSGELTGYFIPWENEVVIKLFTDLRMWQQKYNPVMAPTPLSEINNISVFQLNPTDIILKETADRFYLFRSPLSNRGHDPYSPPTYQQCLRFWSKIMTRLEEVLCKEGEDVKIIGPRGVPAYNIHGLRVATLTALAEKGVPIETLSKIIAGHNSILMTIYYLKFHAADISELINKAAENIKINEADNYRTFLESKTYDEAAKLVVFADADAFRSVMSSKFQPTWSNEGYGVCPYAGARCADGGPFIKKISEKASLYGSVPGGSHNCLRCRHFISGTPFLIQMWMKGNKLIADAQKLAAVTDEMRLELETLEEEKFHLAKEGGRGAIPGVMINRIKQLETSTESNSLLLNEILMNLHSAYRYVEGIKSLIAPEDNDGKALPSLLVSDENIAVNFKETTRFEQITHIVSASHVFPFLRDENYEMEQQHFLDVVFMRQNLMPLCMMPLTYHEKRMAAKAAAEFLLLKVGAEETQQIYDGKITLQGLGFNPTWLPMAIEKAVSIQLTSTSMGVVNG